MDDLDFPTAADVSEADTQNDAAEDTVHNDASPYAAGAEEGDGQVTADPAIATDAQPAGHAADMDADADSTDVPAQDSIIDETTAVGAHDLDPAAASADDAFVDASALEAVPTVPASGEPDASARAEGAGADEDIAAPDAAAELPDSTENKENAAVSPDTLAGTAATAGVARASVLTPAPAASSDAADQDMDAAPFTSPGVASDDCSREAQPSVPAAHAPDAKTESALQDGVATDDIKESAAVTGAPSENSFEQKISTPQPPAAAASSDSPARLENESSEANKAEAADAGGEQLPQRGSVAATVASTEKRRSSGTSDSAVASGVVAAATNSGSGGGGTTAKGLTKDTTRGGEFAPAVSDPSGTKGSELKHPPGSATFDVEQLKTMKGADGIDPTVKERYLTAEAFQEVFGMDEAAFAAQPLWRRQQRKKDVGLF